MSGNFGFTPGGDFSQPDFTSSTNNLPMIATQALRDSARNALASHSVIPVGTADLDSVREALEIANNRLDSATIFPAVSSPRDIAWSRKDWLESSISGWQKLVEPLAEGMASALSKLVSGMDFAGEDEDPNNPIPDLAIPAFNSILGGNPLTAGGIMPMMQRADVRGVEERELLGAEGVES